MTSSLFRHLDKGDQKKAQEQLKGILAEALRTWVQGKKDAEVSKMLSRSNYQDTDWSHQHADHVGYARAMSEVLALLTSKP